MIENFLQNTLKKPSLFLKKYSLETIDVQNDDFGLKLQALVQEVIDKTNQEINNTSYVQKLAEENIYSKYSKKILEKYNIKKNIEELIFNRLGLNIILVPDYGNPGAIMIMPVTDRNVLLKDYFKGTDIIKQYIRKGHYQNEQIGKIDLNHAKVSGIFSNFKHKLYIDIGANAFIYHLTAAEITAIILHELGHAFTYYEYSNRITSVNQVISNIYQELEKKDNERNYNYIYRELKNKLDIDEKYIDQILESKDQSIITGILFTAICDKINFESNIGKYEETSSEQLADQFSARFGYGKYLVTGLDKISSKYSPNRNNFLLFLVIAVELSMVFISLAIIAQMFIGVFAFASIFGFIKMTFLYVIFNIVIFSGEYTRDMTYDNLKYRYTRVRQDLIQQLKKGIFDKSDTLQIIENIKEIDFIISQTNDFQGLFTPMMNILLPINYRTKKEIQYQQMIELLASNDLFIKAEELKHIG